VRPGIRTGLVVTAAVLAVGGALTAWFLHHYEYRSEEVPMPPAIEARRNPYLALQRFLQRLGDTVRVHRRLPGPADLGPRDVLLLTTARYSLTPGRARTLLEWVRRGGHLVVRIRPPREPALPDPLLDPLDIEVAELERRHQDPFTLQVYDNDAPLTVHFPPGPRLITGRDPEPDWSVRDGAGTVVAEYRLGAGWLTVLAGFGFLDNDRIGKHDHAALAQRLLHLDARRGTFHLVAGEFHVPFSRRLWRAAWPALTAGLALLAAWLWARGRRFGPRLPAPGGPRRSLREHVRASGDFLWRHGQGAALLAAARRSLRNLVGRRHPGLNHLPPERLYPRLAQLAGLPPEAVREAFEAEPEGAAGFTRLVRTLETIRTKL